MQLRWLAVTVLAFVVPALHAQDNQLRNDPLNHQHSAARPATGTDDLSVKSENSLLTILERQKMQSDRLDRSERLLLNLTESYAAKSSRLEQQHQIIQGKIEGLRPSLLDKLLPAAFGIFGTLVASWIAYVIQRKRMEFDQTAAKGLMKFNKDSALKAAGIKEISEIKQFRSRQLNEFYAPLEALLEQGLVLRNELYNFLLNSNDESVRFEKISDEESLAKWSLGVTMEDQQLKPFRLIEQMAMLKSRFPHVMSIVSETLRINSAVVKLVHDKVGLVLHDNVKLSKTLGEFLAHSSVLEDVYRASQNGNEGSPKALEYMTAFPRGLQALVHADGKRLRNELMEWESEVKTWILDSDLTPADPAPSRSA